MTRPKRRTKKIDPVKEAEIVRDLVEHEKTQVEIAQAAEVSRRSVQRIKESHRDEIEAHQREVQLRTLRHLDETLDAQNKALAADVLAEGSRTKPQSYRVQLEGAGVIGGKGGPLINIDARRLQVNVDAAKLQALANLPRGEAKRRLEDRLAALAGGD